MIIELGSLGLLSGDDKRALENYVHPSYFRQRKSYDEYYVDVTNLDLDLDLRDLQILADDFKVRILSDGHVIISEL